MSNKKKNAIDEEQALIDKAKNIISLEKSMIDQKDSSYIEGVKYIFTKEFTQKTLSLPIKKRDKDSFQYLKNFIGILDILFKMDESKRHKLYQCEILSETIGYDLFNSFKNLNTLVNKKKINFNMNNLSEEVKFIFTNYIKRINNNVLGSLNLYFYYIGFFIESIDSFKFILYHFLKLTDVFEPFEYKDFCPDLKSNNCLNLIILFFKNIREPLETLVVYALLIFKYQYIFRGIEENIKESILEKSVNQSAEIVKEKTINNPIILEYIFNEFIDNLSYNIIYPNNPESFNEIIINETNDDKKSANVVKNNENNISNNNENIETKNDKIIDERVKYNNENKREIKDDSSLNKIEKPNKDENNSKDNNSVNEEINNKIDDKNNDNLTIIENNSNNNSNNGTKKSNLSIENNNNSNNGTKESNHSIENKITNNNTNEKNININKKDYTNNNESTNKSTLLQNEVDAQILYLINEMKNLKKQSEERYQKLQNEMIQVKSKLDKVTNTIGYIQMRDCAKNLLKPYQTLLTREDTEIIGKNKNKKWELIANKIKDSYKIYEHSKNYKTFIEIIEKSVDLIEKGNKRAHNITLEYYEKKIENIIKENKSRVMNPIKISFLLQINISNELFINGYELLDKFYENNLIRAFTRGTNLEDLFK